LILRLLGAEVETASSTAWAMSKLQAFQPNVLIADLQMPGQDGFALISQLRARPIEEGGRIPAVAFSAHDSPENRAKAFHAGFQEFLRKPTSVSQILSALQGMIAN
jgi:CheY-like chemotaxis protein